MGHEDNLGVFPDLLEQVVEAIDVRLVKRRIHLVKEEKGAWLDQVDGEDESHGHKRFFTSREQTHVAHLLPRGLDFDKHAAFQRLGFVHEPESCRASAEENGKNDLQLFVHHLEGFREFLQGRFVDFPDSLLKGLDGIEKVLPLGGDEGVALFQGLVLLDGREVDLTQSLSQFLHVIQSLLGLRKGKVLLDVIPVNLVQVEVVLVSDHFSQAVHFETDLGLLHLGPVDLFFDTFQIAPRAVRLFLLFADLVAENIAGLFSPVQRLFRPLQVSINFLHLVPEL